jgi:predicted nucleotidyltransferase
MDMQSLNIEKNNNRTLCDFSQNIFFPGKIDVEKFNVVLDNLVVLLKSSDPYKIILFGSYANGNPNENSDIDLLIILDNNHVSKTYQERLNKKIRIRNLVIEINRKVPLDILVYSKEEWNIIKKNGNYFIEEIEKTGKVIYEKAS